MIRPLADIAGCIEANPKLRRDLGRHVMWEACATCALRVCNSESAGCRARQMLNERQRAYRQRTLAARRAEARRYYHENRAERQARSRAYQHDPQTLVALAAKRRARYAKRRAEQGRAVRPYNWTAPLRNKGFACAAAHVEAMR